ncbi:bifunctional phosphoribosyl-AMP cyclohydrolase/phosphoribosyl-ATP diphosphatase HisIE [Paenibacillus sp. DXFW5]|uniref:Histidine biosynthesis bifunctional protein HisIE n=1 Tax=Paenibacillus rhizolycopersici TaxID=2780073 RepID=A0ABS2H307_9BACL|nr:MULTISPECIES: bifunctional phosphoribosyl-AMP cyclohydrolase/phosphoribosyl-ATP diphosphatase HisIE [Paenibacillus]MBM6995842.1 bifunctional phosphoribosyl-AMP cyclohydrolase/phosphoribosyl-ATP diphosphatase HisIE [Paenibacillus rhizolycopersici]GIP48932.1 histidine biosynthesis bifunctional protein HisIE [Paenibacillus sp. J53TS2]
MTVGNEQPLQLSLSVEGLEQAVKWDASGLVPAIVQDAGSKDVLMLAYMNRESLRKSVETGLTWFWSRSRAELWNKGATSGNTQRITALKYDCDGDTLLVEVIANGPACHTGEPTCFYRTAAEAEIAAASTGLNGGAEDRFKVLAELEQLIAERYAERPEGAYTTYLFEKGLDKILKKVGEETAESIIAAKNGDNDELRYEVSDLIYHLLVLLRERNLPLDDIMQELERRHERPRRD